MQELHGSSEIPLMEQGCFQGKIIPAHLGQYKRGLALYWHGLRICVVRRTRGKENLRLGTFLSVTVVLDYLFMSSVPTGAGVFPGHLGH